MTATANSAEALDRIRNGCGWARQADEDSLRRLMAGQVRCIDIMTSPQLNSCIGCPHLASLDSPLELVTPTADTEQATDQPGDGIDAAPAVEPDTAPVVLEEVPPAPEEAEPEPKSKTTGARRTARGEEHGPIFLSGHIRLWRKLMANPIWTQLKPSVLKVAIACLLRASWRDSRWYDGHAEIQVSRGSFITSHDSMARLTRLSVKEVRTAFAHLKRLDFATYTRAGHYTIVNVKSYEQYQSPNDKTGIETGIETGRALHDRKYKKPRGLSVPERQDGHRDGHRDGQGQGQGRGRDRGNR